MTKSPSQASSPDTRSARLTRVPLRKSRPKALHENDFFMLLWVQNDTLRLHLPDRRETLSEGDLLFLRPGVAHGLQGRGEAPMIVAIAFAPELVASLGARHPELSGHLFWNTGPDLVRAHLDMRALAALNHQALTLEHAAPSALQAEAFLLPLCAQLLPRGPALPDEAPAWLAEACERARHPDVFRDGAAGFVRVAGRAHPHVSRTAQKYLGQSPSDFINMQRMDYAARRLLGSSDGLTEIAEECGIRNLSHFHKLFRSRFGQSPARYRRANQTDLVQPRP